MIYPSSLGVLRRLFLVAFAMAFLGSSAITQAGLIDNGTLTRDTNTGIDWLDLSFTQGQFTLPILNDPGSILPGFRVATAAEVDTLLLGVSLQVGDRGGNVVNNTVALAAEFFSTFLGVTNVHPGGIQTISTEGLTATPGTQPGRNLAYTIRHEFFPQTGEILGGDVIVQEIGNAGGSARRGVFLIRDVANGIPATAVTPSSTGTGGDAFTAAPGSGAWFDAPASDGDLVVTTDDGSMITHIALASDGNLLATILDPLLGDVQIGPGDVHMLSSPVQSLPISGLGSSIPLNFLSAASSVGSFPLFLQFDQSMASFSISSSSIPEPSTFVLAALASLLIGVRHRVE